MYIYETKEALIIDFLHNIQIDIENTPADKVLYHLLMFTDDIIMLNMTEKLYPNYESDNIEYKDILSVVKWLNK